MNDLENYNDGYYHLGHDLEEYPAAWCHVIWSRRGPGKTYSGLWYAYRNKIPIIYMKRTNKDIDLICEPPVDSVEFSPYVPLNRDKGINIQPKKIKDGIAGFWNADSDGEPIGEPVALVLSLSAVKAYKGMDLSRYDWILLDEFIPQIGEIVRHVEGEMLLNLYMTAARDRKKRGRDDLKLILFANAENISTPITTTLEIVDTMVEMSVHKQNHFYDVYRGIHLHHITSEEIPITDEEKSGIFKAMEGTDWWLNAFGGEFGNNDFSNIQKISLKGYKPIIKINYKLKHLYVYVNDQGTFYMTSSASNSKTMLEYSLNTENGQKLFWMEQGIDLRYACIEGRMIFEKYTMYDLIVNYKKFFDV